MKTLTEPRMMLLLSSVGFRGGDLDSLHPSFATERDVSVGLRWYPCATGPDSWTLAIAIGLPIAAFLKKFGELVAADLYDWSKEKLAAFFATRPHHAGFLHIELGDVEIYCWHPIEVIESKELLELLKQVDPSKAKVWHLEYIAADGRFTVSPADPSNREGLPGDETPRK